MTRQEIIDAIEGLGKAASAALMAERARIDKELHALQAQCGEFGHIYAKDRSGMLPVFGHQPRCCVFCESAEPDRSGVDA